MVDGRAIEICEHLRSLNRQKMHRSLSWQATSLAVVISGLVFRRSSLHTLKHKMPPQHAEARAR